MDKDEKKCTLGALNEQRIESMENRQDKIERILDKVRDRLPWWGTIVFALLTGAIGWLSRG